MKSLLVHLDASPRSALRLQIAQGIAAARGAELTAMYGVMPALQATPWIAGEGFSTAIEVFAEVDREQRTRARALYESTVAGGAKLLWADAGADPLEVSMVRHALYADLLVLGQADASDTLSGAVPPDLVPALLVESGKPALVVPYAGSYGELGREVLVAWKPTREAAHALGAALPWLQGAARVHVARALGDDDEDRRADTEALEHWLRLHGVAGELRHHEVGEEDAGEALLSLAADTRADLLVMGCYGHSRMRELVLGGASRTVLASMTLPVLMAH